MFKTYKEAVLYLEKYIPTPGKKHPGQLGLDRMKYLMKLLGDPQYKYPTIHITGTSGKGSTAAFIASILSTQYKVGLHTSPHLVKVNERIKIFDKCKMQNAKCKITIQNAKFTSLLDIPDNDLIYLLNQINPIIEQMEKSEYGAPSYFEIAAAMAFLYFYQQKVDFAVVEVGMGGRCDATNVIHPLVSVITNVGLDHTEILGDTVEKIAEDKAGIIKPGIEVVTGVRQKSVINILKAKCKKQNAKMSLLNRDFSYKITQISAEGSIFDYKGIKAIKDLKISLLGEHQVGNAAIAVKTVEISRGPLVKEKDIKQGLENAFISGRLEIINHKPLIILDGAHNPDKIKALVKSIKTLFPNKKITVILAIKKEKNAREMLKLLLTIADGIILTEYNLLGDVGMIKSYDCTELVGIISGINNKVKVKIIENPVNALKTAITEAGKDSLILVTGSLYLIGEIKKFQITNPK